MIADIQYKKCLQEGCESFLPVAGHYRCSPGSKTVQDLSMYRMGICKRSSLKKHLAISALLLLWIFFSVTQFSEIYEHYTSDIHEGQGEHGITLSPLKKRVLELYIRENHKLIKEWFTVDDEDLRDPLLNKHEYTFALNSDLCKESHPDLLIVIHSDPEHFEQRMRIRNTWCSHRLLEDTSIVCVFMLGERYNHTLQDRILEESRLYRDIVTGNFVDSYRNLTYKHVMALYWIECNCNNSKTIVKADDDVVVNIYKLVKFSVTTGHIHNNIYCSVFKYEHPRRNDGKWLTSWNEYPFKLYPDYCAGFAYIMSADEAMKLSKASEDTSFYWIDDVYVTGILALKSDTGRTQLAKKHAAIQAVYLQNETYVNIDDVMFYHGFKDWERLWNNIVAKFAV